MPMWLRVNAQDSVGSQPKTVFQAERAADCRKFAAPPFLEAPMVLYFNTNPDTYLCPSGTSIVME